MTWNHQSDRMWPFQLLVSKIPSTLIHFAALHWVGANSPSWGLPYSWSIGCRNGSFLDGSFWRAEDSQAYGSDQVRCGGWQQSLWCFRCPSAGIPTLGWENGEPPLEPPCSVAFSGFFQCGGVLSLDGNLLSTCLQFKMKNHYLETAEDKNWTAGGFWDQNLYDPLCTSLKSQMQPKNASSSRSSS